MGIGGIEVQGYRGIGGIGGGNDGERKQCIAVYSSV